MTAEIGILNKTSIVLAADSAATLSSHKKVFNTANKLFPLSYFQPVGIMIYNNSTWMGIPFELIIKSYTKNLHDKSFSSLPEYRDDFIKFLKDNFRKFITEEQIHEFIEFRLYDILGNISEHLEEIFKEKISDSKTTLSDIEKEKLMEEIFFKLLDRHSKIKDEILPEFIDYKFEEFKLEFKSTIDKILPGFYVSINTPRKQKYTQRIYKCLYHELICNFSEEEDYSGIVISGYGIDEIFPTICDVKIGEILSNKLRYQYSEVEQISSNNSAIVCPYAQRDMVDTFFRGINPQISEELNEILMEEFETAIGNIHKKHPEISLADLRPHFSKIYNNLNTKIDKFSVKNYINPIIQSIGFLRKEDLIEFAESLINITSIKRKTNSELQSVGGPIDIAVITKHEGFIWIKRKDIIDKQLNSAYYNREFRKNQ